MSRQDAPVAAAWAEENLDAPGVAADEDGTFKSDDELRKLRCAPTHPAGRSGAHQILTAPT